MLLMRIFFSRNIALIAPSSIIKSIFTRHLHDMDIHLMCAISEPYFAQDIHQIWLKIKIMALCGWPWLIRNVTIFTLLLGVIFIMKKLKKFCEIFYELSKPCIEKFIKQESVTEMWRFYCRFIESILTFPFIVPHRSTIFYSQYISEIFQLWSSPSIWNYLTRCFSGFFVSKKMSRCDYKGLWVSSYL